MATTPPNHPASESPDTKPPRSQVSPVRWILLGCGGLLVVGVAFGGILFFVVKKATAGPEEAVKSFLASAGSGDYSSAHRHFSVPLQEAQPLEAFTASAKSTPSLFQVAGTTFNERSVDLNGATLAGTLELKAGTRVPASFKLVKENGAWKIIAYRIGS